MEDRKSGDLADKQYDVALSFAGEDRPYVSQVADELSRQGLRYFYDADQEVHLWGKDLAEELTRVYTDAAGVVVVFVSQHYAEKDWTRLERRAALSRAMRERREYVLPARFDATELPGVPATVGYVDLRSRTPTSSPI